MSNLSYSKSGIATAISLLIGIKAVTTIYFLKPVAAQLFPRESNNNPGPISNDVVIPLGTRIPLRHQDVKKILVTNEESLDLILETAANIKDRYGNFLVPVGSKVMGFIQPASGGAQFVTREIIIDNQRYPLYARSGVVTRIETINEGASVEEILGGTLAGSAAAAIIAGTTGDRRIDALEVLAGAAIGTLAGWGLPETGIIGGGETQVISIDPNQDLDIILESNLTLTGNNRSNSRHF
ncbi:hypothetical protein RGRSB_1157 [cyanobacterium endosymbiont of Rhopalodia gibberula]|uniref:hypothetical protein n=1 Tax=cyanobacterium endosymbiont of Rhopalodia gibberula TaxID=1763363 RepID=UPI000DC7338F|nr:hypothetical protein [cyanobacterium endosymbiont of Rhopalodia gibberula]BBA79633.1 hypothetical protein RGRSB_1157 [cyanobacterium endosymbiont of Rhopalodia gibberula]